MAPARVGARVRVLAPDHLRGLEGEVVALCDSAHDRFDCHVQVSKTVDGHVRTSGPYSMRWHELESVVAP